MSKNLEKARYIQGYVTSYPEEADVSSELLGALKLLEDEDVAVEVSKHIEDGVMKDEIAKIYETMRPMEGLKECEKDLFHMFFCAFETNDVLYLGLNKDQGDDSLEGAIGLCEKYGYQIREKEKDKLRMVNKPIMSISFEVSREDNDSIHMVLGVVGDDGESNFIVRRVGSYHSKKLSISIDRDLYQLLQSKKQQNKTYSDLFAFKE